MKQNATLNSFTFLSLLLSPALFAAPSPRSVLAVPSAETALHVAVPIPNELTLNPNLGVQLIELNAEAKPVVAELIPALAADGTPARAGWRLAATIPPNRGAKTLRRFELKPAGRGAQTPPQAGNNLFRFAEVNDKSLGLWEGNRPVLVYNYGVLSKEGVPSDRNRSTYVHPLYGLDGEVLTDDFPKDHYHHRGLFWAWPHVNISNQPYSLWDIRGIHQRFERWLGRQTGAVTAVLGVENGWYVGEQKVVQERVWLRVYAASAEGQMIDCEFTWIPLGQPLTLAGAEEKSYGGLTLRFAPRTNTVITTPQGNGTNDLPMTRLPWADLSAQFSGSPQPSGAAIFIAPDHPDYPPMWLTRHYGVLCVGWPGVQPATFPAGQPIRCRYRVWIHRQAPAVAALQQAYQSYSTLDKVTWEASNKP